MSNANTEVLRYDDYKRITRIEEFRARRAEVRAIRLRAASDVIRIRLQGHSRNDIDAAIARAKRVIDGNGDTFSSIELALGECSAAVSKP